MLQPDYFPLASLDDLLADGSIAGLAIRPLSPIDPDAGPSHVLVPIGDALRARLRAALAWLPGSGALGVDLRATVLHAPENGASDPLDVLDIQDAVAGGEWIALHRRALTAWGDMESRSRVSTQGSIRVDEDGLALCVSLDGEDLVSTILGRATLQQAA